MKQSVAGMGCVMAVAMLWAAPVAAVDIMNEDTRDRVVTITEAGKSRDMTIGAGLMSPNICQTCTIAIVEGGQLEARGEDWIIIRGGKLDKP